MYSCDGKTEFSASLLQSSVSHDPSEIILISWFIISVETGVLLHNVFLKRDHFVFDSLINTKLKRAVFVQNTNLFWQYKSLLWPFIYSAHPSWTKVLIHFLKKKEKMFCFHFILIVLFPLSCWNRKGSCTNCCYEIRRTLFSKI